MPNPTEALDPGDVDHVSRCLSRILRDRNVLLAEVKKKDAFIEKLKAKLRIAEEWQGRLHEKCMVLEAIPGGVLDAWDEQYLMDHNSVVYFKRLSGGRRRVVLERQGFPRLMRTGKPGDKFLRELIEEASGRKRTSPSPEEAA